MFTCQYFENSPTIVKTCSDFVDRGPDVSSLTEGDIFSGVVFLNKNSSVQPVADLTVNATGVPIAKSLEIPSPRRNHRPRIHLH